MRSDSTSRVVSSQNDLFEQPLPCRIALSQAAAVIGICLAALVPLFLAVMLAA